MKLLVINTILLVFHIKIDVLGLFIKNTFQHNIYTIANEMSPANLLLFIGFKPSMDYSVFISTTY